MWLCFLLTSLNQVVITTKIVYIYLHQTFKGILNCCHSQKVTQESDFLLTVKINSNNSRDILTSYPDWLWAKMAVGGDSQSKQIFSYIPKLSHLKILHRRNNKLLGYLSLKKLLINICFLLQIIRSFLLFPTIERMSESPNGRIATPLLCWFRYALYVSSYLFLKPCPETIKSWLIRIVLQRMNMQTEFSVLSALEPFCLGKHIQNVWVYSCIRKH